MNYQSERIIDVLPRLNTSWFLPALQREFAAFLSGVLEAVAAAKPYREEQGLF